MANVTLAVSEELRKIMRSHPEMKWSEVARQAMRNYAKKLELMDEVTRKSKLTEKDALELGTCHQRRNQGEVWEEGGWSS